MPASGRWHRNCHSSRCWSLLAITATPPRTQPLYSQNRKGKWPGRAGSSGGRGWKRWPKPRFDLSPISRARIPTLPAGIAWLNPHYHLGAAIKCVAIPRGCPEQGEIQEFSSSWNCLGKAEPRSIATASPQHPESASCQHPSSCTLCTEKWFQHTKKRGVLPTEMSSGTHVQPKFSCGHPNLTAQLEQKEAEQELVPKIAPIKGSCQATGNVKQCPALFPRLVECFCNRDTENSDSSKFLELRLLPANFPVTSSTFGCEQAQMFTSGSP